MQRLRRTMMFVPGNNPAMMQDAYIYGPDSIMLDLEDSVSMAEKDTARLLVHNALKSIDYGDTEMVVRINPLNTPYGKKDVEAVVKAGVSLRVPQRVKILPSFIATCCLLFSGKGFCSLKQPNGLVLTDQLEPGQNA